MRVSRAEFQDFVRKYDQDRKETNDMLHKILELAGPRNGSGVVEGVCLPSAAFAQFEGVIPHPNNGRNSKQTSFVNVSLKLKTGIDEYNSNVAEGEPNIVAKELEGSLLSWSHNTYSNVSTIIGRYPGLNSALGKVSLEEAKKLPHFGKRPCKYNREVSAVLSDICSIIPIVILARGDWAARELLRNKFQNSSAIEKKKRIKAKCKERNGDIEENDDEEINAVDYLDDGDDDNRAATRVTKRAKTSCASNSGGGKSRVNGSVLAKRAAAAGKLRAPATDHRQRRSDIPSKKVAATGLRTSRKVPKIFMDDDSDKQSAPQARALEKDKSNVRQVRMKQSQRSRKRSAMPTPGHLIAKPRKRGDLFSRPRRRNNPDEFEDVDEVEARRPSRRHRMVSKFDDGDGVEYEYEDEMDVQEDLNHRRVGSRRDEDDEFDDQDDKEEDYEDADE